VALPVPGLVPGVDAGAVYVPADPGVGDCAVVVLVSGHFGASDVFTPPVFELEPGCREQAPSAIVASPMAAAILANLFIVRIPSPRARGPWSSWPRVQGRCPFVL
jgi:hypothetical protein